VVRIRHQVFLIILTTITVISIPVVVSPTQKAGKFEIEQWREVLRDVKRELKSSYYDPEFHGMNIESRFELADAKMKTAESLGQLVGIVAQVLIDLNDSHTLFVPPFNATRVEYGWLLRPVGSECYVAAVRPGSDAEAKGLRVGDKVLSIDGRPLDRTKVWLANYLYYMLRPQSFVTLVVESPEKHVRQIVIKSRVREGSAILTGHSLQEFDLDVAEERRLGRHRFYEPNEQVLIWKMPAFELSEDELASKFGKLKNRRALILDLRGNPGGYVSVLEQFAGYFFDSNIKLADLHGRKKFEPMIAKSRKEKAFKGELIVLIDGDSASAAEVFARVVQLEKRGIIVGDRSAGAVMQSRYYPLKLGVEKSLYFGISATEADVVMNDGKSLENVGVVPDELMLPTPQEMSMHYDPVLSHAAALVGLKLDPKKAGELFPVEWNSR